MKSNKFIALALAAAITLSLGYVSTAAVSKNAISVSAASVSLKSSAAFHEMKATIKFTEDLVNDSFFDGDGNYKCTNGWYEQWELNTNLYDKIKEKIGEKLDGGQLYDFVGWTLEPISSDSEYDTIFTEEDAKNKFHVISKDALLGDIVTGNAAKNADGAVPADNGSAVGKKQGNEIKKGDTIIVYPVFRRWETDKEYGDYQTSEAEKAAAQKEIDDRNGHLDGSIWTNSSGNNVTYYWYDNGVRHEGVKTAWPRTVLLTNSKGEFTSANYDDNKDPKNGRITKLMHDGALKAAKVNDPKTELAYVYDVHFASNENILGFIDGKQAQVRLSVSKIDLGGYVPYVYRIVYGANGYKRQKVENLDVGKYDVTFYARNFGPYVLVLVPKDRISTGSEYDNPPTADASSIPVMLLAAASLSAAGSAIMRRKRELCE